ncbi:MAG: hypothetical protein ABSG35_14365 [Syntrophobacteraceae bacterium]|jgi:hypothetical protein
MSNASTLKINHHDLIRASSKKRRFGFFMLPHGLQDRIINGMDEGSMTLVEASALVRSKGFRLSPQAISVYYRAVRLCRNDLLSKMAGRNKAADLLEQ